MALQTTITVPSPSQIKNDQPRYEMIENCWAQRSVRIFHPGGGVTCDVTAIAIAAATVYSFNHVTCTHYSHALIQNRVLMMVSAAVLHVCLRKGGVTTVVGLTIG